MDKKTGKREYAFLFVVLLCFLIYQDNTEILEIVIWPFITFIAASAGLHIYDKKSTVDRNLDDSFVQRPRNYSPEEFNRK